MKAVVVHAMGDVLNSRLPLKLRSPRHEFSWLRRELSPYGINNTVYNQLLGNLDAVMQSPILPFDLASIYIANINQATVFR